MGSSFTLFALPLLVFKPTHSATNLALTTASNFVPYLLFGLVLGALADRVNRKRMMLMTDLGRAAVIVVLPVLALSGALRVEDIYAVAFVQSTLGLGRAVPRDFALTGPGPMSPGPPRRQYS